MSYTDKAIEALKAAEATLRDIITQALASKAYRDLVMVAGAADKVSALISELDSGAVVVPTNTPSVQESHGQIQRQRAIRSSSVTAKRSGYPRFLRDGDRLVKVAWSKKERQPYEHRAPQAIIQTLIDVVRKRKGEGKLFEAADVLPLTAANGEEYPSYQSYLALAWLRHVGIVTKRGREGYILRPGMVTSTKLETLWVSLPTEDSPI